MGSAFDLVPADTPARAAIDAPPALTKRASRPTNRFAFSVITSCESGVEVPTSHADAMASPMQADWIAAEGKEYQNFADNDVWDLVDFPSGRKIVDCRFVYTYKPGVPNKPACKARIVAKGFTQIAGVDYKETYSPVAQMTSLRLLMHLVAIHDLELHGMDVTAAFLHGTLQEEIYMRLPPGHPERLHKVAKLKKSIYGLKQSSREWFKCLSSFLESRGFQSSLADPCIFTATIQGSKWIVAVYVDDLLIANASDAAIQSFKKDLAQQFKMTDQGPVQHFLGMQIVRDRAQRTIFLSQRNYLTTLLAKFQMEGCRPVGRPISEDYLKHLMDPVAVESSDQWPYAQAIGSLLYAATTTRPDISTAVSLLASRTKSPCKTDWANVKLVLRYLAGTLDHGLLLGGRESTDFTVYTDANYTEGYDAVSRSGCLILCGASPIVWASSKQDCVSTSANEAEIVATYFAVKKLMWIKQVAEHAFGLPSVPVPILCDNQKAIRTLQNGAYRPRSRHMSIRYLYPYHLIQKKEIYLQYVATTDNLADPLTKPLPVPRLRELLLRIGVHQA